MFRGRDTGRRRSGGRPREDRQYRAFHRQYHSWLSACDRRTQVVLERRSTPGIVDKDIHRLKTVPGVFALAIPALLKKLDEFVKSKRTTAKVIAGIFTAVGIFASG